MVNANGERREEREEERLRAREVMEPDEEQSREDKKSCVFLFFLFWYCRYIIGAHYDSTSESPSVSAPGLCVIVFHKLVCVFRLFLFISFFSFFSLFLCFPLRTR